MKRRDFLAGTFSAAFASNAFTQERIPHVGALIAGSRSTQQNFEEALKALGWSPGKNLLIDYRITAGNTEQTRVAAKELISLQPTVLFAVTNTAMAALHSEGSSIPTVFAMVSDPISMRYIDSFSRPGRNITGFTPFEPSLGGKWVGLLKEIAPNINRIGMIYNPEPGNNSASFRRAIDDAAENLGILAIEEPKGDGSDIERLIKSLSDKPNSGLLFLPDALTAGHRDQIVQLVARCHLPAIYPLRSFCAVGGLVSYGVDVNKIVRSAAAYVDRILRGASAAELPVQAPTEFELIINQAAARALGLQLKTSLLARADEVIE